MSNFVIKTTSNVYEVIVINPTPIVHKKVSENVIIKCFMSLFVLKMSLKDHPGINDQM